MLPVRTRHAGCRRAEALRTVHGEDAGDLREPSLYEAEGAAGDGVPDDCPRCDAVADGDCAAGDTPCLKETAREEKDRRD